MRLTTAILPCAAAILMAAAPAMAGDWTTTYGVMQLPDTPRPGALRAPYSMDEGRIVGEMRIPKCFGCGPEIVGVWVERGSAHECASAKDGSKFWGNVTLTFKPGYGSFSGQWDYCGTGSTRSWTGTAGGPAA